MVVGIVKQAVEKIKKIEVQGATNIALFSLSTLEKINEAVEDFAQFKDFSQQLALARLDEPLTRNIIHLLLTDIKRQFTPTKVRERVAFYRQLLLDNKKKMSHYLSKLIQNDKKYFSHCHSTSLESGLILAHQAGKRFHIWQTETRPLYQGHITASHLLAAGLSVTLVVDDIAPWLVSKYDDIVDVQVVFIGADVLSRDGWALNKVGSFALSLAAKEAKVPLYVVASLLKFVPQSGRQVKIEKRPADEVWPERPAGLEILNLAFDKVPPSNIKALVTEAGLIKPEDLEKTVFKVYPQLKEVAR